MKVAIIGAAGFTGGELLRLLRDHPDVDSIQALSQSHNGQPWSSVHRDLRFGGEFAFQAELSGPIDCIFLAGAHGQSAQLMERYQLQNFPGVLIDLSQDFRLQSDLFCYGLAEVNKKLLSGAKRIANPGCFATAIQLGFAPLAKAQVLTDELHVTAITGSTGAGQKLEPTLHYSWRHDNISAYKVFQHQHEAEILHHLRQWQGDWQRGLIFVPLRGPFTRGIFASLTTACTLPLEELLSLYREFYQDSPFVKVSEEAIDLKSVINTNNVAISVLQSRGQIQLCVALDNLLKGASGQAVQNMNLAFGLPQDRGLRLKAAVY